MGPLTGATRSALASILQRLPGNASSFRRFGALALQAAVKGRTDPSGSYWTPLNAPVRAKAKKSRPEAATPLNAQENEKQSTAQTSSNLLLPPLNASDPRSLNARISLGPVSFSPSECKPLKSADVVAQKVVGCSDISC